MTRLQADNVPSPVVVVDSGLPNNADFQNYNPMLKFYAESFSRKGFDVNVRPPGQPVPVGSRVATCDPGSLAWLQRSYTMTVALRDRVCVLARIDGGFPAGGSLSAGTMAGKAP